MQPQYIKAMPRSLAVKRAVLCIVVVGCAVVASEEFLLPWIRMYLSIAGRAEALSRLKVVMFGLAFFLLLPAVYASVLAKRIFKARQFPLPDSSVIRDTLIVHGRLALIRAWVFMLCALILIFCAVFAAYLPFML